KLPAWRNPLAACGDEAPRLAGKERDPVVEIKVRKELTDPGAEAVALRLVSRGRAREKVHLVVTGELGVIEVALGEERQPRLTRRPAKFTETRVGRPLKGNVPEGAAGVCILVLGAVDGCGLEESARSECKGLLRFLVFLPLLGSYFCRLRCVDLRLLDLLLHLFDALVSGLDLLSQLLNLLLLRFEGFLHFIELARDVRRRRRIGFVSARGTGLHPEARPQRQSEPKCEHSHDGSFSVAFASWG